ncbi:ATPase-like protein [Peziza echinospora]|nr:ATPase-like protein [Peziza echinospora]
MIFLLLPYTATAALLVAVLTVGYTYRKQLRSAGASGHVRDPATLQSLLQKRLQSPHPSSMAFTGPAVAVKTQLQCDKTLYHQLQHLPSHPECLPQARSRLFELLDKTIYAEKSRPGPPPDSSIFSLSSYCPEGLHAFIARAAALTDQKFAGYTTRRKAGGSRELLPNVEYAKYWLRIAAPVKYVDGSWLGGSHRLLSTPTPYRPASRVAWQVLSEELGDGDLAKNHVWVYRRLLAATGSRDIGLGHEPRFINNTHNPNNEARVWTAALAQQLISLFPAQMFPEMLGFNMAYESLPCHLLITIQELKELGLDPYYFVLHVSIDNGHSGHAAMGVAAVISYLDSLPTEMERDLAWRRVQAGYMLAEGLATTPSPITQLDRQVEQIFADKCETAKSMHSFCPARIGGVFGRTLTEWLDPERYHEWGLVFVKSLSESRWIVKGDPGKSRLIKELEWGGRMFGAYTTEEVGVICRWIEEMPTQELYKQNVQKYRGAYSKFTNGREMEHIPLPIFAPRIPPPTTRFNLFKSGAIPPPKSLSDMLRNPPNFPILSEDKGPLLPESVVGSFLLLSAIPFENFPAYPSQVSSPEGMSAIKTLRALYGFLPETDLCAGMDEVRRRREDVVGVVELAMKLTSAKHTPIEGRSHTLMPDSDEYVASLGEYISRLSQFPTQEVGRLLGVQLGFVWTMFLNNQIWGDDGVTTTRNGMPTGIVTRKERDAIEKLGRRILSAWMGVANLVEGTPGGGTAVDMGLGQMISWEQVVEGWMAVVECILGEIKAAEEKGYQRVYQGSGISGVGQFNTDDVRGQMMMRRTSQKGVMGAREGTEGFMREIPAESG